jgi:hypothetical protein
VDGVARAGFDLPTSAQSVKVEVLDGADRVVDTLNLGMQPAGRGRFEWKVPAGTDGSQLKFRVVATSGKDAIRGPAPERGHRLHRLHHPQRPEPRPARLGEVEFSRVKVVS